MDTKAHVYAQAGWDQKTNDVIVKFVNATAERVPVSLILNGTTSVATKASVQVLSGDPATENSVANPTLIAPRTITWSAGGPHIRSELEPWSLSVVRIPAKR